jgi:hypothetical protein
MKTYSNSTTSPCAHAAWGDTLITDRIQSRGVYGLCLADGKNLQNFGVILLFQPQNTFHLKGPLAFYGWVMVSADLLPNAWSPRQECSEFLENEDCVKNEECVIA